MVKSATRVCQILTLIGQSRGGLRNAEIAKALSFPTSSTSGLLASLVNQKFLMLDSETQKYSLGPQLLSLAGNYLNGLDLIQHCRPVTQKLAEDTGESVEISIRSDYDVVSVFREESKQLIKHSIPIGRRSPLHATASGKAILAFLPETEIEKYFSSVELLPITKKTITDPKILRRQLEEIRTTGIAYNWGELSEQINGIAAPIFNIYETVVASMVVTIPNWRYTKKKEKHFQSCLKIAANELSQKLGYRGYGSHLSVQ